MAKAYYGHWIEERLRGTHELSLKSLQVEDIVYALDAGIYKWGQ